MIEKILRLSKEINKTANTDKEISPLIMGPDNRIGLNVLEIAKIAENCEQISVKELDRDKILWWTGENNNYFFSLSKHCDCYDNGYMYIVKKTNQRLTLIENADIKGASFGGMIIDRKVSIGWPVEYYIENKKLYTEEIINMGTIPVDKLIIFRKK